MIKKRLSAMLLVLVMLVGVLAITGCAPKVTQEQYDAKVTELQDSAAKDKADLQSLLDKAKKECSDEKTLLEADIASVTTDLRAAESELDNLKATDAEQDAEQEAKALELETAVSDLTLELDSLKAQCAVVSAACEKLEEYDLNVDVAEVLTDSDLARLIDGKVEFDGEKLDVHEEVILSSDVKIVTSEEGDEEFSDKPYLVVGDDRAVEYKYVFDDPVDVTLLDDDETLKINFLGEDWELVGADSNSVTLVRGQKLLIEEGETLTVMFGDEEVEIVALIVSDGSGEAKFRVNGEVSHALGVGDSDEVNGYHLYISELLPNEAGETAGGDVVEFKIFNDEIKVDVEDGDWVDEDIKLWKYSVDVVSDELLSIGVYNDEKYYKVDDETPAVVLGEKFSLPKDFLSFGIEDLSNQEFDRVEFSFDDSYGDADEPVLMLEAGEGTISVGAEEVDEVGFNGTAYIYRDDEGEWQTTSSVVYENDDYTVTPAYAAGVYTFDEVSMTVDIANSRLGATEEEVDSDDVMVNGVDMSSREYDVLTTKGVKVLDVENNVEDDKVVLEVPSDDVEATLCFM